VNPGPCTPNQKGDEIFMMVRPYKTKLDWVTGSTKISVVGVCQEDDLEKEIALEIKAFYLKEGSSDVK
jgi:hypothetical protein